MDLENNHRGRNLGEIYSANSFNDNEIAKWDFGEIGKVVIAKIKKMCSNYI